MVLTSPPSEDGLFGEIMPEKRIQIPAERVLFEVSKDGVSILDTTVGMKEVDGNMTAVCDMCSTAIGPMKDIEHIESPGSNIKGSYAWIQAEGNAQGECRDVEVNGRNG